MHGLNSSALPMTTTQFKTTSVAKAGHRFMNKRNRNKVYARLEKLRDLLGFGDQDAMPFGVYRGSGGGKAFVGAYEWKISAEILWRVNHSFLLTFIGRKWNAKKETYIDYFTLKQTFTFINTRKTNLK